MAGMSSRDTFRTWEAPPLAATRWFRPYATRFLDAEPTRPHRVPRQPSFGLNEGCRSITHAGELHASASRSIRRALLGGRCDRVRWCRRPCHRGRRSPRHRGRCRRTRHGRRRRGGGSDSRRRSGLRRHPRGRRRGARRWRCGVRRRCRDMRRRKCRALLSGLRPCRGRRGRRRSSRPLTQSRRRGRDRSDRQPWRAGLLFRPVLHIGRSWRRRRRRQSCVRVRRRVQIRGRTASRTSGGHRRRALGPRNRQCVGPRQCLR